MKKIIHKDQSVKFQLQDIEKLNESIKQQILTEKTHIKDKN